MDSIAALPVHAGKAVLLGVSPVGGPYLSHASCYRGVALSSTNTATRQSPRSQSATRSGFFSQAGYLRGVFNNFASAVRRSFARYGL